MIPAKNNDDDCCQDQTLMEWDNNYDYYRLHSSEPGYAHLGLVDESYDLVGSEVGSYAHSGSAASYDRGVGCYASCRPLTQESLQSQLR